MRKKRPDTMRTTRATITLDVLNTGMPCDAARDAVTITVVRRGSQYSGLDANTILRRILVSLGGS